MILLFAPSLIDAAEFAAELGWSPAPHWRFFSPVGEVRYIGFHEHVLKHKPGYFIAAPNFMKRIDWKREFSTLIHSGFIQIAATDKRLNVHHR